MYLAHYGLTEPPFSITPDPRFVFLSERHRDALAHLLFGVDQGGGGGFVQLTGEVGTGKTTLCRVLLEQLAQPRSTPARVALVLNPQLTPIELLETICEELRLDLDGSGARGSRKALVDLLNAYLLEAYAQGLRVVLIIDEAQNLSTEALEQVRLLTNLETPTQKLLQILLLGQPELREKLARDDLRQLAQRITARFHLTPLDPEETGEYLRHRFRVAGGQRFPFTAQAVKRLHRHAGGVPRLINVIAERALLAGYAHDEALLSERWIDRAAREALAPVRRSRPSGQLIAAAASLAAILVLAGWWSLRPAGTGQAAATAAVPPTSSSAMAAVSGAAPTRVANAPPAADLDALSARLRSTPAARSAAWRDLLILWQIDAQTADATISSNCAAAIAEGVYCARGRADLDTLAALTRPATLRLRAGDREAWALLLGADAINVRLQVGGDVFDTPRLALEPLWNGEYAALWPAPTVFDAATSLPFPAGATGPGVDWVDSRLQSQHPTRSRDPGTVDAAMAGTIRRFQRAHGLVADGLIGPETMMALATGLDGPRLLRVLE